MSYHNRRENFSLDPRQMPPIRTGQYVTPKSKYPGWQPNEVRRVIAVIWDDEYGNGWRLLINNPLSDKGRSQYNPNNFTVVSQDDQMDTREKPHFFAMKLHAEEPTNEDGSFNLLDVNKDHENDDNHYDTSPLYLSKHQATQFVKERATVGEVWVICQTVLKMEAVVPPPPPVPFEITEYR